MIRSNTHTQLALIRTYVNSKLGRAPEDDITWGENNPHLVWLLQAPEEFKKLANHNLGSVYEVKPSHFMHHASCRM